MPGQMEKLVEEMKSGQYKGLKLVTISMGGNDICTTDGGAGTEEKVYREHLKHAFQILSTIQQEEPIRVFYTGLPNIPDLGRQEILEMKTIQGISCNQFRTSGHNSCVNLLNYQDPEQYQQAVDKVIAMNEVLRAVVNEAAVEYKNLDIRFGTRFFETEVKPEWLAIDCFHPNKPGQEELARITWEDQDWFQ